LTFDDEKEYSFAKAHSEPGMVKAGSRRKHGKSSLRIAVEMSKLHRLIHVTGNAYDSTLQSALRLLARNIGWYRGYKTSVPLVGRKFFYFMFIL